MLILSEDVNFITTSFPLPLRERDRVRGISEKAKGRVHVSRTPWKRKWK